MPLLVNMYSYAFWVADLKPQYCQQSGHQNGDSTDLHVAIVFNESVSTVIQEKCACFNMVL